MRTRSMEVDVMLVKTILVALNEVDTVERTIAIAAELGGRFDAHVIGM